MLLDVSLPAEQEVTSEECVVPHAESLSGATVVCFPSSQTTVHVPF